MKKIGKTNKVIMGITLLLFFFIGVSYGAWSDTLSVKGIFSTANFSVEFGEEKGVNVDLVKVDGKNKVTVQKKVTEFNTTKNDPKNINIDLDNELMRDLAMVGYMLRIQYPIQTSEYSKIKAVKAEKADFNKPNETIEITPDYLEIVIDEKTVSMNEEIDKSDYKIPFCVYRQIETSENKSTAVIFIKAKGFTLPEHPETFGSIDYGNLQEYGDYAQLSSDNAQIEAQLKVKYSLKIPIVVEQFNTGEFEQ